MRHAAEVPAPKPFDVHALWDMNNAAFGYGETSYRAWLGGATQMQTEATTFWNDRLGKDVAALTAFGQCTNPGEAFELQMQYARDAMTDCYEQGQRMMRLMRDVARENGMPVGGARRHARKATVG